MKIGILTLRPQSNYGGILQAAALFHHLKNHSEQVVLINKELCRPLWKRLIIFILSRTPYQNIKGYRHEYLKTKSNLEFISRHIPDQTSLCRTDTDLKKMYAHERFDAVIVGSDQVWRWDYIKDRYFTCFFLDYIPGKNTRKIAYAASFGKDHWQCPDKVEEVSHLLSKFHAVSTREESGSAICRDNFDYENCEHVLDPTLLVDRSFYDSILQQTEPHKCPGFLLTYVLDETPEMNSCTSQLISRFGNGLEIVDVSHANGSRRAISTYQWLRLFHDADLIITDSFHGMVFSIIFNKQFWVVGNKSRGLSRFTSLLKALSLESRLYSYSTTLQIESAVKKIDYQEVNKKLLALRIISENFIKKSLS